MPNGSLFPPTGQSGHQTTRQSGDLNILFGDPLDSMLMYNLQVPPTLALSKATILVYHTLTQVTTSQATILDPSPFIVRLNKKLRSYIYPSVYTLHTWPKAPLRFISAHL